ncbi:hypothetical protein Tco_0189912 [Tanacetum coccineum]
MYTTPHLSQLQITHSFVLPSQQYQSHMDHQTSSVSPIAYNSPQYSTQPMTDFPQMDSGLVVPVFTQGDDPISCLNKAMDFLTVVASSSYAGTGYKGNATSSGGNNAEGQAGLVKCYNYQGEGHMARQCTQHKRLRNAAWFKEKAMLAESHESGQILDEEQLAFLADPCILDGQAAQTTILNTVAFQTEDLDAYDSDCDDVSNAKAGYLRDNEITSDINIILYSQYLQEMQQAAVQDTNLYAQQDSMILSVIEQMSEQMINHVNTWEKANREKNNESLTAKLERYKERALGYQNPFYLKKAKRIKPTLYDGSVISSQHAVIPVIDDEETLILEEVSQSIMLAKQNNPISKEKKVNTTPINYVELNRLSEDFGKRFVPKQELSAEQDFWLQTLHPNTDQSVSSSFKIKAPKELPMVSLVNTSLKKLKYHLGQFDTVMKKRITPDAITEGEWGFEHTKAVFLNECFEIHKKELFLDNDRLLHQIMSQDILLTVMNSTAFFDDYVNVEMQKYFENNDLKAQLHAKDTTICKLKEHIKSMRENNKEEKVKQEMDEIETINIEVEHSVVKLLSENELLHKEIKHLKKIYKDQFDSIKKTRALSKEHWMFKLDLDPLALRLLKNRDSHIAYLKYTQEQTDILRGIVKQAKAKQPLDNVLEFACKHAKRIHELLVYVRDTCPTANKSINKLVAVTPMNKVKKVRIEEFYLLADHSLYAIKRMIGSRKHQVKDPICDANVKHTKLNANSELICVKCKQYIPFSSSLVNDSKFLGTVRFGNDQIAYIIGYGDYQLGNVTISRVYYVEGLEHNLFFVGQFYDSDLEVAFWKNTCFIQNLDGVDLLSGSRDTNLYTISLDEMLKTSPISKDGLVRGIPKLKFKKDHLCSACALGKSKKSSYQPKAEDTNQEKLYLLHRDL